MHQTEITLEFCENKDKPEMKCNGKCHLAKKVQEEPSFTLKVNSKTKEVPRAKLRIQENLFFLDSFADTFFEYKAINETVVDQFIFFTSKKYIQKLIKPPIV